MMRKNWLLKYSKNKLPPRHDEHMVEDETEYFPAAQLPVTPDNPVVAQ